MDNLSLFPDALIAAFLGYGVVFAGLIMLLVVVAIMGKVMAAKKTVPAAQTAAAPAAAKDGPVAPGSAGKIAIHNVSDRDAAMLMAIVADRLGKPINELRFKSIKEVK